MKRIVQQVGLVLFLITAVYSFITWRLLRGAGAYRMGTSLGKVLSVSRPWTTLAAIILGIIVAIRLLLWLRRRSTIRATQQDSAAGTQPVSGTQGRKRSRIGRKKNPVPEAQIPPAVPFTPAANPELLPGDTLTAAPGQTWNGQTYVPPTTQLADPVQGMILTDPYVQPSQPYDYIPQAQPPAPVPSMQETFPVSAVPQPEPQPRMPHAPVPRFCPQCGSPLEGAGKFCPNCGCKVEGGGV